MSVVKWVTLVIADSPGLFVLPEVAVTIRVDADLKDGVWHVAGEPDHLGGHVACGVAATLHEALIRTIADRVGVTFPPTT